MQHERDPIRFRPVNKGLGFHPFSDGLPYTPPVTSTPVSPPIRRPLVQAAVPPQTPSTQPSIVPARESELGIEYLVRRCVAFFVDTALHTSICALALGLTVWRWMPGNGDLQQLFASKELLALTAIFLLGFSWALTTAQEIAFGTTLGKRMVGLRIEGNAIAIFLRAFFFWVSLGFVGLGLFSALFHPKRRCWHDAVVDIQPL